MEKISGKIIFVDDERYEKDLLEIALKKKQWNVKVEYFSTAKDALAYLCTTEDEIFLIISDLNMPEMSGLDFKKNIDNDSKLNEKAIPFIFATTAATKEEVKEAYNYRVQGYFKKPFLIQEQADMLDIILKYWVISQHPSKDERTF
jgi:DNA-binding NtrC family response regulator